MWIFKAAVLDSGGKRGFQNVDYHGAVGDPVVILGFFSSFLLVCEELLVQWLWILEKAWSSQVLTNIFSPCNGKVG